MNIAFVFPGQGSQSVGMGQELAEDFPVARQIFEEIDDALDQSLSRIYLPVPPVINVRIYREPEMQIQIMYLNGTLFRFYPP